MNSQIEHKKNEMTRFLHHVMACFGGFFAGYAILLRCDFMGNAQTSNWIYLVHAILGRNITEAGYRLFGVLLYMLGAFTYVLVVRKTNYNVKVISLIVNAIAVVILARIPSDINPIFGLYPIFFAMSLQWNAFPGAYDYVSSTIFSTNNTRQVALSFSEFIFSGDRKQLHKCVFFIGSLLFFHIGVVASYYLVNSFNVDAIWFGYIILAFAGFLLYFEIRLQNKMGES